MGFVVNAFRRLLPALIYDGTNGAVTYTVTEANELIVTERWVSSSHASKRKGLNRFALTRRNNPGISGDPILALRHNERQRIGFPEFRCEADTSGCGQPAGHAGEISAPAIADSHEHGRILV